MITLARSLADLGLTIGVECFLVGCLVRPIHWRNLINVALINAFTNPLAHLALAYGWSFWTIESWVILTEMGLFRLLVNTSWSRALCLSAVLNGTTVVLALILEATLSEQTFLLGALHNTR